MAWSVGIILFLGVAEQHGAIRNEFSSYNTMADYMAASIALMTVTVLLWLVITRLNETIRKAQNNEQAEKAANDALRLSEARYRLLVEQSPQGILITNNEGYIVLVNPFGCRILGYAQTELIGKPFLSLVEPEMRYEVVMACQGRTLVLDGYNLRAPMQIQASARHRGPQQGSWGETVSEHPAHEAAERVPRVAAAFSAAVREGRQADRDAGPA